MKLTKIVCSIISAPDLARRAYDAPLHLLVSWGGRSPPHSSPLDAFDRCSWTFVGTKRKDGHPQFLKRGCALEAEIEKKKNCNAVLEV